MTKGYKPLISTQVILGLSLGLMYILLSLYVSHCWSFLAQSSLSIGSIPIVQGDFWLRKAQIKFRNSTGYSNGSSSFLANELEYSCVVERTLRFVGHGSIRNCRISFNVMLPFQGWIPAFVSFIYSMKIGWKTNRRSFRLGMACYFYLD